MAHQGYHKISKADKNHCAGANATINNIRVNVNQQLRINPAPLRLKSTAVNTR